MQSLFGRLRGGQILLVGIDNSPFGLRRRIGDIVESTLIVVQHVEPARYLISRDVAESLGYPGGQLAVMITPPDHLIPVSLLDLEQLFARKLRRGRLGVLRLRPSVNNTLHLMEWNALRDGDGASSPSGRTLGSYDIAYMFALQPDIVRNPRDDFIRRRAASGELLLIDARYLFPQFGRQFSGF